jgi:CPA1 family monovalent cation:H+ antiporter
LNLNLTSTLVLLSIAAIVAVLARKIKLQYTVGLLATGLAIALSPKIPTIRLTKDLLFSLLLPPLIFEAAFSLNWKKLRRDLIVVIILATVGVVISASIIALGTHSLCGWSWGSAILLAVLISATDPVSVIATFKETGVGGRLKLLIEAESLFNDGTAAAFFTIALSALFSTQHWASSPIAIILLVVRIFVGAIACGLIVGGAALAIVGRTNDHLVEMTLTTVAAYASFLLAEKLGCSGIISAMSAGLLMGNLGITNVYSDKGRESLEAFWEFFAFVVNSIIFLLMGGELSEVSFRAIWLPALIVIALTLAARALSVYLSCAIFAKSRLKVSKMHQAALIWGGLRGALALALALGLPQSIPHRSALVGIVFATVGFSILVQGSTMPLLLRRIGEIQTPHD